MLDDFDIEVPEDDDGFGDDFGGDFDDFDDDGAPPEESGNRVFVIIASVFGVLILLTLCIGAYVAFVALPSGNADDVNATTLAQNTERALFITQTADAAAQATFTPTNTMDITATDAPVATDTPAVGPTQDPGAGGPTADPRTATVQALLTQASVAQTQAAAAILTVTITPTASALPDAGFIDDVGAPGLLAMATLLVVVIFVTRRVRTNEG